MAEDDEFTITETQKRDVIDLQAQMKALIPYLMTVANFDLTTADPPTWNVVGDHLLPLVDQAEFEIVEQYIKSLATKLSSKKKGE